MKTYHNRDKGVGIVYDQDVFLINGMRTPFGKFCGTLGKISPTDLGIFASRAALKKAGVDPQSLDQAFIANIGQASTDAYFLGRHVSLYAGLKIGAPALMVQRICASGFETIISGTEQIQLGKAESALCCGTENMSLAPTVSFGNRMGYPLGRLQFKDMLWEALDDTAAGYPMGRTAENLARKHSLTREQVDEYALLSQNRAIEATSQGWLKDEIEPMNSMTFEAEGLVPRKMKMPRRVENFCTDENIRPSTMEGMGKLPSTFEKEGVQTAANSSGIVDGAGAVIIGSAAYVKKHNLQPLSRIVASSSAGVDPKLMGLGPVPAIEILLEMTGLSIDDIDLIEINEAFGAQTIACEIELGIDRNKLNVNGGAIAFGHPLGATGSRLSLTISRELVRRKARYGIATACIGGGQGTAILFKNVQL